jgi:transcriptional regulator CtsR
MNMDFHYMIDIYQLSCGVFFAKGRGVEWEGGRRTGGYVKIVKINLFEIMFFY